MPGGRKSLRDETVQANVINLSWLTISRALNSKTLTEVEKRNISLEIVKRTCPKDINLSGKNGDPLGVKIEIKLDENVKD